MDLSCLDIVKSLPEYQQEDLINIIQRRRLERRRELLAERIKEARAEYAKYSTINFQA